MASITVGDWFRVTGPKRADGSASWWMGKPGGWQPRAFDGVWPSGQLIRQHVLNIDFSQDFQALEVFRTSESSAKFVQARVEIPDPQGPPGGVRSFWFNVAKYGEDWVTILPQHASGGGSSDQSRSAGGWWSRAAASGVSAEAAQDASGAGSPDQYWSRSGGGWSRVAASDISAEAAQDASGGGSADQSWSRGGWWSRVAASDVSAEAAQDASGAGGGWWSRYEGWAGWGGNRGAGGPPEAQPEYLCPTCGGAAFWDINCCIRWCPRCSVASDVESVD